MSLSIHTVAFFKAAGVFRVKTDEKARKRFDDAWNDYLETGDVEAMSADEIFDALLQQKAAEKQARIDAEIAKAERAIAREAAREEKAAKLAAMPIATGFQSLSEKIQSLPAGRYVLSAAQNNTLPDMAALGAILKFCEVNGASLLLGRLTYNKAGFQQPGVEQETWYAPELEPYLVKGEIIDLGGKYFLADANVIPTATWPTSNMDGNSPAGVDVFIPATKMELRVSAAGKHDKTKIVASTGCLTQRNYILRKTGAKAAASHCIGALYVDTFNNIVRHLEIMPDCDGFFDYGGWYSADGYRSLETGDVAAFQPGDIHAEKVEQVNLESVKDHILWLQPENVIVHDLLDFSSRNHHNIKDPFFLLEQYNRNNTVEQDLQAMANVLDIIADNNGVTHVIESNHDLAIDTWLKNTDWRGDPINAVTYLECATAKAKGGSSFNTLQWAYEYIGQGSYPDSIRFHQTDDPLSIAGVDMSNHGHNGINGSRGSPKQFAALGRPMNTGHTHSPSIYGRVYTAGVTAALEMGYNKGASSWAIAHVVTYSNGQRQIIFD